MATPASRSSRIVLVTTTDLAALNASSVHFLGLARALIAFGVRVQILARQPSGPLTMPLQDEAEIIYTPTLPRLPSGVSIPLMWPQLRRLAAVGNMYARSGIGTLALVRAARGFGYKKIIVEANGWLSDDLATFGSGMPWQVAAQRLQIAEANAADAVRVVTEGLGRLFVESGVPATKLHHIPNGTDLEIFSPGDRDEARKSLGIARDSVVLVFVGNLWPAIDLPSVFKAATLLTATLPKLDLVIVGEGVSQEAFEAEAKRTVRGNVRVHWLGALSPLAANRAIAAADVGLAPFITARNERIGLSPLKLHDYAAAARVVVASDLPGIADHRNEPWLHLAAPHDPASYAQAIMRALSSDRVKSGLAARRYAEAHFGWSVAAARVAALF